MSLADFAARFANFGIILKAVPSSDHPAIPANGILALPIPANQAAALAEFDGTDPTEDANPPAGRVLRRVLRQLREDDDILAWHVLQEGANFFLHMHVTPEQATQWFRRIDFTASTRVPGPPRAGHVFFGVS
jgi:hypothetical protein